jgi:hypothetical protein
MRLPWSTIMHLPMTGINDVGTVAEALVVADRRNIGAEMRELV